MRKCRECDAEFRPRYRDKGFYCSESCRKREKQRLFPRVRTLKQLKKHAGWMKRDREQNRDKYLEIERQSRSRARKRLGTKEWRERAKRYNLHHQYGMTLEEYDELLNEQNGNCAICGNPPADGKTLHVDHNHETGQVRGLLCHVCNVSMAAVDRDIDWGKKAFIYASKEKDK